MSNINQKKQPIPNPFHDSQPQSVGNTYGERARLQKTSEPAAQESSAAQPRDTFEKVQGSNFPVAPNASFAQRKRSLFSGSPHRPRALDNIQNGATPRVRPNQPGRPSDRAIVDFLDKVLDS
ncbi:MAG: hypothetical protein ABH859_06835 [Pseudomonadota bacterium]